MTNPKEALEWHERRNEANIGITDELRKYASSCAGGMGGDALRHIADRIDEEYEKRVVDALLNDGLPMSDKVMAEHGWVRLPIDANGEVWHPTDKMAAWGSIEYMVLYPSGDWYIKGHDMSAPCLCASEVLHAKPPAVEDVLREFAKKACSCAFINNGTVYTKEDDELLAEYAAKLQLKD